MFEVRQLSENLKIGFLRLDKFSSEENVHSRREAEKKGAQYLLKQLFPEEEIKLLYHANGKPYAENKNCGISISHSHHLLAILVDQKSHHTGLDVELIRDKVLKIRSKFLSEKEMEHVPEQNVIMHLMAWCVKETIYKIYAEGMLDFRENIIIEPFQENSEIIMAHCHTDRTCFTKKIKISRMDEYLMAWPVEE